MNEENDEQNNPKATGSTPWDVLRDHPLIGLIILLPFLIFVPISIKMSHDATQPGEPVMFLGFELYRKPKLTGEAVMTENNMWLRSEPIRRDETQICTLPGGHVVEIKDRRPEFTKVETQCPNGEGEKEGIIFDYDGERPYEMRQ